MEQRPASLPTCRTGSAPHEETAAGKPGSERPPCIKGDKTHGLKNHGTGFSLIELLITLFLGGLLLVTLSRLYIDAQHHFMGRQQLQTIEENIRFGRWFLRQEVYKAGFRRRPDLPMATVFGRQNIDGCTFAEGEVITSIEQGFCIRYQPRQPNELSCEGTTIEPVPTVPYTVTPQTPIAIARLTFTPPSATTAGAIRCNGHPLVNGLADVRLEYGIGSSSIETFVNADNIANRPILAIRYHLLLADDDKSAVIGNQAVLTRWKTFFPQTSHPDAFVYRTDQPAYRFYRMSSDILLPRNLLP